MKGLKGDCASAERHILHTAYRCGFDVVLSRTDQRDRSPKAPARLVQRSGRDGGGEAPAGLWTTESNTPHFKRC
jgi:hypothetical protein